MRKLKKSTLDQLAKEMPLIPQNQAAQIVGGDDYGICESGFIYLKNLTEDTFDRLYYGNGCQPAVYRGK